MFEALLPILVLLFFFLAGVGCGIWIGSRPTHYRMKRWD